MFACKSSNLKNTFFVLTIVMFVVTTTFLLKMNGLTVNVNQRSAGRWTEALEETSGQALPREFFKVFHLDLKGGPPKMNFLLSILPLVRSAGANAILVEYEDMFPFSGRLRNVSADNAYSLTEVRRLVKYAEGLKMEMIPLVQTFGHLEYVLKLAEFQHLREVERFPQEICPLNREAVDLVKEMISQVMAVHTNSRYIHIGCDEVRNVGVCSKCSRVNPRVLFSRHVLRLAEHIKTKYPRVTPLIWDDMLRNWAYTDLVNLGWGSAVEPVVWVYGQNILTLVPPFLWKIYQRVFPRVWLASAFKGAFGETEILPDLTQHLQNHLSWMRIISDHQADGLLKPENVSGIFLTGWSRYDHFAVLCELLPVAIPSLLLSLVFLQPRFFNNSTEGFSEWLSLLNCPSAFLPPGEHNETYFKDKLGNCSFPGSDLYSGMVQLARLRARVAETTRWWQESGWTTRYNLRKNFTNPWRLVKMFSEGDEGVKGLRRKVYVWKMKFSGALEKYFDRYTRSEWVEQNIRSLEEKLSEIGKTVDGLLARGAWPRRPLR